MTRTYIKELNIKSFGKFKDRKIILSPDFNLLYGMNESGKTTIMNFIEGMFYGFDEGNLRINYNSKREIYRPKDSYVYAGELKIVKDNETYLLYRDFESGSYRILNLSQNKELEFKKSDLNMPGKFFLGVDYDIYKSLISNKQSQKMSLDNKKKILEKLASNDIDYNFSIKKSIDILENRLKTIGTTRSYTKPYYLTKEKINGLKVKIQDIDRIKKDYFYSFEKLNEKKKLLSEKEKQYEKDKETNRIYNLKRSDENFKSYRKWSDKLFEIDEELSKYEYLKNIDIDDYKDNKESIKDNKAIYTFAIIAIIVIALISKKYFIFVFTLPFLAMIFLSNRHDGGNDQSEYSNLRTRYLKRENLLKERDKVSEVLEILKNQDLNLFESDEDISIDFSSYNNIAELENISKLENEIKRLRSDIHLAEKELLTVDNILKDEAGLRDDLKYQIKKLDNLKREIKAVNIAKETILKIADENQADIYKLNNKLKAILYDTSKSSLNINLDKNLDVAIRDMSNFDFSTDQLSTGFFDQVNFAMKLSLVEESDLGGFLIFDDAFINYDIERLIRFLYLLLDESYNRQIIYFTCHKREEEFFETENIDVNKIQLEDIWYMLLLIFTWTIPKKSPWRSLVKPGKIIRKKFSQIGKIK